MSHTAAEGVEMADAARKTGRIVQIGSQRVSSVICAKAKELVAKGALGDLMVVEGSLGRNDPTGAWEYPPPTDLSPETLDWDTWQGTVPKRAFDPLLFARWRCWKEYGTGVAGDLLVHLVSGMMYVLGINEPPKRTMAMGGILRWKDGRNMPDVHAALFQYGDIPVYMRLNLGTESPEIYRFQGSKGILELTEFSLTFYPQSEWTPRPATMHPVFRGRCAKSISRNGIRSTTRSPAKSQPWRVSRTAAIHGTTKSRICGISFRRCAAASRWWKTLSSVTTPRWPATWPMNPTSEKVPCTGTQRRRALKHS